MSAEDRRRRIRDAYHAADAGGHEDVTVRTADLLWLLADHEGACLTLSYVSGERDFLREIVDQVREKTSPKGGPW